MKSLYQIEMDYGRALKQAAELDAIAGRLQNQANQSFPQLLSNVQAAWQGDNASAYVKKASELQPRINKTAGSLRKVASTIRTVAKNTYEAEKRAYEIAQTRTYS